MLAALGGALGSDDLGEEGDASSWALGQPDFVKLAARARGGHSPSARALVNASDLVVTLALSAPGADPAASLRERVLGRAGELVKSPASVSRRASTFPPEPTAVACEVIGLAHAELRDEVERQKIIDALGATGGPGHEAVDRALAAFLERVAPFMDFEVVLVSIVRDQRTFHRVHRGFPASYGNVDIIPRAASYCTHTVSGNEPLVVHDGRSEAFFRRGVMVSQMQAWAYLGIPVRANATSVPPSDPAEAAATQVTLGALCAIGTRPRTIIPSEVAFFSLMAEEVEAMVNGDAARLEAIRVDDLYRASFFERMLDAELARCRERDGYPVHGVESPCPMLAIVDRATAATLGPIMAGELADDPSGAVGVLVASATARDALIARAPGFAPKLVAATNVGSAAEWISSAQLA